MRAHYLKLLGLTENSSTEEIRKAYKRLAKKYHPDVNKEPDAQAKFIAIAEAYDYLMNTPVFSNYFGKAKTSPAKKAAGEQTKAGNAGDEQEKVRRAFEQSRKSRLRAEQYAKMSFREFRRTDYFRNTLREIIARVLSFEALVFLAGYGYVIVLLLQNHIYLIASMLILLPISFLTWVLLSRPGPND